MRPAVEPRPLGAQRLLAVDPAAGLWETTDFARLPELLSPGDLLVLNDAATLPGSLRGRTAEGAELELRLTGGRDGERWSALVLGAGDWRSPTEHRGAPPTLREGDALTLGPLLATVRSVGSHPRLVEVSFDAAGERLWSLLYAHGRPVQYSYLRGPLDPWDVHNPFAAQPWAAEPPSAGRPLSFAMLSRLRAAGVDFATVTHAAGLSSTGDAALDATLPWPERTRIPEATVRAVARARARGGRVLAVGTTVVRSLEGSALRHGELRAWEGVTDLRLGPRSVLRVVDGILTGMHEPGTSHFELLHAFATGPVLQSSHAHASAQGLLQHEFGDSALLLPGLGARLQSFARARGAEASSPRRELLLAT